MKVADALKKGLESYTGRAVRSIKVHADPVVESTWAARAVMADDGQEVDFLVIGMDLPKGRVERSTPEEVAEAIEETKWEKWPPRAGKVQFVWRVS